MQSLNADGRPQGQSPVKGGTCGQKKPLTLVPLISITVYTATLPPEAWVFLWVFFFCICILSATFDFLTNCNCWLAVVYNS